MIFCSGDFLMDQDKNMELEACLKKKVKKSASVRFAPEESASALALTVVEDALAQDSDIDIRAEIHNCLPSNTLHRRKKTVFVPAVKSFTLPHRADSGRVLSLSRMRQLSYPTKKRKFLPPPIDASDLPTAVPLIEATPEKIEIPATEEEKINELLNIRSLPIQLSEKKLYRNAIVNSMRSPQYAVKAKKRSCSDVWSSFLKGCFSRFQLWNRTLKKIEGQFGTGVVSYFVFLRWLILLNFGIFLIYFFLIILPYIAFSFLPHRNTKLAPNETILTEEYLQRFPKYKDVAYSSKRTSSKNITFNLDEDLLSNLGTLLDNYVPDEILDLTVRYSKKNYTGEERRKVSVYCDDRYKKEMANHTKETSNLSNIPSRLSTF